MNIQFSPHKEGTPITGTLCLPCESSFAHCSEEDITAKHPDWELIDCPVCGNGCYISESHKKTLRENPRLVARCTQCALTGRSAL